MFDSVWFTCPKCGGQMEAQSKAGACSLINYSSNEVPETIAGDIAGDKVRCETCDKIYVVGEEHKEKLVSVSLSEF